MVIYFFDICTANAADTSIIAAIFDKFNEQSDKWFSVAQSAALTVFYWMAVLEVAYIGIRASISSADIKDTLKQFVMMILAAGFFLAVINNYQEWTTAIIDGLQKLAGNMTTLERASDNPFKAGLEIVNTINNEIKEVDWNEVGKIISLYIACFIVLVCFALITARFLLIKCEAVIAIMAALLLVGLGASSFVRNYAINTLRYIFAVAFKLFTMQLVLGIGFSFINDLKTAEMNFDGIIVTIGFAVVLLSICNTIPDAVASIINGSHTGNGAGLMQSMSTVGNMGSAALGAVGGAVAGTWAAGTATNTAHTIAKESGVSGLSNTATSMAKSLGGAAMNANMNKTSMQKELSERLAQIKGANILNK